MKNISSAFICMVLLLTPAAMAAPSPAGSNFQVNQVTHLSQYQTAVAQDAAGDFVLVWTDRSAAPEPDTVKIRLYAASGAATTGEIVVAATPNYGSPPRVARTPSGEIAVVWENDQIIYLRRYNLLGQPEDDAFVVGSAPDVLYHSPDVVLDQAGSAFVAWAVGRADGDQILLQRLGADDHPLGPPEQVSSTEPFFRDIPRLALNSSGSLLVSWNDHRLGGDNVDVWARRFDGPSQTWDPEVQISPAGIGVQKGSAAILYPEGDGAVVYNDFTVFTAGKIMVRRLDASGAPSGDPIKLGDVGNSDLFTPNAAAGSDGTAMVVWQEGELPLIQGRFFDRTWNPLGDSFQVSDSAQDTEWLPNVAAGAPGNFVTTWTSGGPAANHPPTAVIPPAYGDGRDGSEYGVFAQRFETPAVAPACVPAADTLCLHGRFRVRVSWQNGGATGAGQTVPLTTETGAFWFFAPDNLELMIQVLDTRAENGYFEVHYGAVSNVDFTITVTDTKTGDERTYHNPAGVFGSVADDQAFAEAPPTPGGVVPPVFPQPPAAGRCTPSATVLCELNRFAVTADFVDPASGATQPAQAIPVTGSSGAFWFTDILAPELIVKMLDGRAVNHFFWVYYGALSDQEYTLTVMDLVTGARRTYHNAAGHLGGIADTRAFRARALPSH
jgi:hypothetical protein